MKCRVVNGTSLMFISTHLTAHEGVVHCQRRNDSIAQILAACRVSDKRFDASLQVRHMFFNGDMNYRTTFDPAVPTASSYAADATVAAGGSDDDDAGGGGEASEDTRDAQLMSVLQLISDEKWFIYFSVEEHVQQSLHPY